MVNNFQAIIDESLGWFQDLLRFNTSNPPGGEREAIAFIAEKLTARGLCPKIIAADPLRPNLVVEVGRGSGAPILLSSHIDVVPVEEASSWTRNPWAGEEHEGAIWGRGALDMKYKTAFDLSAMAALKKIENKLRRTVKMVVVADEEVGGKLGSGYLTSKHLDAIRAEYVLNEIGGFTLPIAGKTFVPIQTGEKGSAHIRFTTRASAGHSSIPPAITSPLLLAKLIEALSTSFSVHDPSTPAREFVEKVAASLNPPYSLLFQSLLNPSHAEQGLQQLPPALASQLRAILHTTAVGTVIRGGHKLNVLPETCSLETDCRVQPHWSKELLSDHIQKFITELKFESGAVESELISFEGGYQISSEDPAVQRLMEEVRAQWGIKASAIPVPFLLPASSDSSAYARAGIKPIGFAPLLFPEGFPGLSLSHGVDERIPIGSFNEGLLLYLGVLERWATTL